MYIDEGLAMIDQWQLKMQKFVEGMWVSVD